LRTAVVLVNKTPDSAIQRIATAEKIASEDFQAWLRYQIAQRYENLRPQRLSRQVASELASGRVYQKTAPKIYNEPLRRLLYNHKYDRPDLVRVEPRAATAGAIHRA
jgi:hypothetical protein